MCPPIEQLVLKGVDRCKEKNSEILHNHSFTNILFYLPSNSQ
jgi:hypothetical protein